MKKDILLLFLNLYFLILTSSGQNLMTNGSFENFIPPCPAFAPNGAFSQVLDWKPANDIPGIGTPHAELYCGEPNYGNCLPGPVPNVGSDGIAYVGFHTRIFSPPYNESIYQVLANPLIAGNTYTVSFDLMDCQSGLFTAGPSDFCVYTNVDTIIPACPTDNPLVTLVGCIPFDSISNTAWKNHSFSFIAPPFSNIIAFSGAACNVAEVYYYFDNVVLTTLAINASFVSSDNHICPGTCTDFTNLTVNATSFQWLFPGANPATSSDINPSNICYNVPGTYPVTLIASNGNITDSLTLNNYITVYPTPAAQGILQSGDTLIANQGAAAYQWYYSGNLIPGATEYFYVAIQGGDYNVVATDANGCEVEAAIFDVVAVHPISIGEGLGVWLYPNPVNDFLEIILPAGINKNSASRIDISLLNLLGEDLSSIVGLPDVENKYSSANIILDVRRLARGMYWVVVNDNNRIYRNKIIRN